MLMFITVNRYKVMLCHAYEVTIFSTKVSQLCHLESNMILNMSCHIE